MPERVTTRAPSWELLYDAVAFAMLAYTRAAFRVDVVGKIHPEPGLLLASTHRSEADVPLLCPAIYGRAGYLRDRTAARVSFAARDDMFDRGFFAGFPPSLPLGARRLLYRLHAGSFLPRVRVHPVPYPSATRLRLGRALESLPASTPLAGTLPDEIADPFLQRASECGRPAPRTAGEVLTGVYADLLWRSYARDELGAEAFDEAWWLRAADGAAAVRRLVEHLQGAGDMLLVFPEGHPSSDGAVGPLQPGLELLVRRGRPPGVQVLALAYDPLRRGRPRAIVAFGPILRRLDGGVDEAVLGEMRRTTPLTAGQVVAAELLGVPARTAIGVDELDRALLRAVDDARATGRPVEPALEGAGRRRGRLAEALSWLRARGLVSARAGSLELDRTRILAERSLSRLARERESTLLPPDQRWPSRRSPVRGK